jgi:hypothetical protein
VEIIDGTYSHAKYVEFKWKKNTSCPVLVWEIYSWCARKAILFYYYWARINENEFNFSFFIIFKIKLSDDDEIVWEKILETSFFIHQSLLFSIFPLSLLILMKNQFFMPKNMSMNDDLFIKKNSKERCGSRMKIYTQQPVALSFPSFKVFRWMKIYSNWIWFLKIRLLVPQSSNDVLAFERREWKREIETC